MILAVLMTCHNRKAKTLECLRAVNTSAAKAGLRTRVYLTDDGSTDGTAEAVRAQFPEVTVLHGDGNLYWTGGMRLAFSAAIKEPFDVILWLNDDTILFEHAFQLLSSAEQTTQHRAIIVGTTVDALTGQETYGGVRQASRVFPLRSQLVKPGKTPVACDTFNGNCVWIPRAIIDKVGNLDGVFRHGMADFDYGFRARKAGFVNLVAPGTVGTCSHNTATGTVNDVRLPLMTRLRKVVEPKAFPPAAWWAYVSRYAGALAPAYFIWPYLKTLVGKKAS